MEEVSLEDQEKKENMFSNFIVAHVVSRLTAFVSHSETVDGPKVQLLQIYVAFSYKIGIVSTPLRPRILQIIEVYHPENPDQEQMNSFGAKRLLGKLLHHQHYRMEMITLLLLPSII